VVDPSGSFLYASNNLDPVGGISAYKIGATGDLTAILGSPFPTNLVGPAGLAVHPNGKFLYIAMAGTANPNNKIVVESIDGTTGALSPISSSPFLTGSDPNAVTLDPAGKFLFSANVQDSNVTVFTVDANAGSLSPLGGNSFSAGPGTFRVVVNPSGTLLFAANNASTSISAYTIAPNGLLTPVAPISGGQQASGLAIVHHP
jgi:6-phosphogluconolactonase (cycloisomerase 2 family)